MAAADEPRPRAWGTALRQRQVQAGHRHAQRLERRTHGLDDEVRVVDGQGPGALALHLDGQARLRDRGGQLVAQLEGQAEGVEARAEVGRGRGYVDPDRSVDEGHRRPAAAAAWSTSASMTASTRSPADSSAVAVSLSPWPVTVIATVRPA